MATLVWRRSWQGPFRRLDGEVIGNVGLARAGVASVPP